MSETTENAVNDTTQAPDVTVDQASPEQQEADVAAQTAQQSDAEAAKVNEDAPAGELISDASKESTPTDSDKPEVKEDTVAVKLNDEWYDAVGGVGPVTVSTATGTYDLSDEPVELTASEAELVLASPAAERA